MLAPSELYKHFNKAYFTSVTSHASNKKSGKLIPVIQFLYSTYGAREVLLEFHLVENEIFDTIMNGTINEIKSSALMSNLCFDMII